MPKLSLRKIDIDIEREILNQFWKSLSRINNPKFASDFFSDLLTNTEKYMLAKRYACAVLLTRGRSASDINKSIHLTYTAIGSVSSWVKNAKPLTTKLLESISKEKDTEKILDKIDAFLDKLSPLPGTDWSRAGKEKYKRAIERSVRNNLR